MDMSIESRTTTKKKSQEYMYEIAKKFGHFGLKKNLFMINLAVSRGPSNDLIIRGQFCLET